MASGSLPYGLYLSSSGEISGWPYEVGTITFRVFVEDTGNPLQKVGQQLSITLSEPPATKKITITKPASGEIWYLGNTYTIEWSAVGVTGNLQIQYSWNYGNCQEQGPCLWVVAQGIPPAQGTYEWEVPSGSASNPSKLSEQAHIRIVATSDPYNTTALSEAFKMHVGDFPVASKSFANGVENEGYSAAIKATGEIAPFTKPLTSGSLPDRLLMEKSGRMSSVPKDLQLCRQYSLYALLPTIRYPISQYYYFSKKRADRTISV